MCSGQNAALFDESLIIASCVVGRVFECSSFNVCLPVARIFSICCCVVNCTEHDSEPNLNPRQCHYKMCIAYELRVGYPATMKRSVVEEMKKPTKIETVSQKSGVVVTAYTANLRQYKALFNDCQ